MKLARIPATIYGREAAFARPPILRAGDPGFIAAGSLPSTSTSGPTSSSMLVLAALSAALLAIFGLSVLRREARRRHGA